MNLARLIEHKRDGHALQGDEWRAMLDGFLHGRVPDYQMSAMLMAVAIRGLDDTELSAFTETMLHSGRCLTPSVGVVRVDKHSTGGVGDKVSLVLAPLVASCGLQVPMLCGRGLGHTGGTIDKLESIPGFETSLSMEQVIHQLEVIGCALFGQTGEIAPIDKKLYALRDVTGSVSSIPLVAASIMSKKLAEGLNGLVIDVKHGQGAFFPERKQALELARCLVDVGNDHGCSTTAVLTAMDRPLGFACGLSLEVEEAIATLKGEGPKDVLDVTLALGVEMLVGTGHAATRANARAELEKVLASGTALEKFRSVIERQGGNPAVVDDPGLLPQARFSSVWEAPRSGVVHSIAPRLIGEAVIDLGGGRRDLADAIDHSVGFVITAKPGDHVTMGQPLATVHVGDQQQIDRARQVLEVAVVIGTSADTPTSLPLIGPLVTIDGVAERP